VLSKARIRNRPAVGASKLINRLLSPAWRPCEGGTTILGPRPTDVIRCAAFRKTGQTMKSKSTRPETAKSILVYDGECSFCRRSVKRIAARDRGKTIEFVARQTEGLTKRFPALDEADFNKGMRLITPDDVIYVGADAAHQVAKQLPYWRRMAWLYRVPGVRQLARAGYVWIAANRQSLGGRCDNGTCEIK